MDTIEDRLYEQRMEDLRVRVYETLDYIVGQIRQFGPSDTYDLVVLTQPNVRGWVDARLGPYHITVQTRALVDGGFVQIAHPNLPKRLDLDWPGLTPAFKHRLWKRLLRNMPADPPVDTPLFQQFNFVHGVVEWLETLLCRRLDCEREQLLWEMINEETPGNFHGYVHGPYDAKLELQINADKVRIVSYGARGATRTPSFLHHGHVYTTELEEWMRNFVVYMYFTLEDHDKQVAAQKTQPATKSEAA